MIVSKARFTALVAASLQSPPAAGQEAAPPAGQEPARPTGFGMTTSALRPKDEATRAANLLGELVRRPGLMIEVLPDDVLSWLADWPLPELDVRLFEASEARSVGVGHELDDWLRHARAVVIEVSGDPDLPLHEVSETAERLYAWLPADVDVVFGASVDEALRGRVTLRIVALGEPA